MKKPNRTFLKRKGVTNNHHVLAKTRHGVKVPQNLIRLDENRHAAFHLLFGTRTYKEAAAVLLRADEMVRRKKK